MYRGGFFFIPNQSLEFVLILRLLSSRFFASLREYSGLYDREEAEKMPILCKSSQIVDKTKVGIKRHDLITDWDLSLPICYYHPAVAFITPLQNDSGIQVLALNPGIVFIAASWPDIHDSFLFFHQNLRASKLRTYDIDSRHKIQSGSKRIGIHRQCA